MHPGATITAMGPELRKLSLVLLLLSACAAHCLSQAKSETPPTKGRTLSTRELAAKVRKSLVVVLTQDSEGNVIAQGSGFFFRSGLAATNLHVLKRASQAYVKSLSDGVSYKIVSVVGFDLKRDICVLKLLQAGNVFDQVGAPVGAQLPLSTHEVAEGDDVLVAGNPEGLEASFSKGIVSGIRPGSGLIQMDAPISPGSSGGPVLNARGEVVGLAVSSLTEGQNLNFAVPIKYLRELRLVWNLPVRIAGGLAVSDLEADGFRGPVRSVAESDATSGMPAEPFSATKFNRDGQVEQYTLFKDGVEYDKVVVEYSDDGLKKRSVRTDNQGRREDNEFAPEVAVSAIGPRADFDKTVEVGAKGDPNFKEDKYDSSGHLVEEMVPEQSIRRVMKYDSRGREIERLEYRQDTLWFATRSTYEDNERGDWIKRRITLWSAKYPDRGFAPLEEETREIAYYDKGGS